MLAWSRSEVKGPAQQELEPRLIRSRDPPAYKVDRNGCARPGEYVVGDTIRERTTREAGERAHVINGL